MSDARVQDERQWRYRVTNTDGWICDRIPIGTVLVDGEYAPEGKGWCFERRGELAYVDGEFLNESTGDPIADQESYEAARVVVVSADRQETREPTLDERVVGCPAGAPRGHGDPMSGETGRF